MAKLEIEKRELDRLLMQLQGSVAMVHNMLPHPDAAPWDEVLVGKLPTNPGPYGYKVLNDNGGWWQREYEEVDGCSVHHTYGSASILAMNKYYMGKSGGHPTMPYSIWISENGKIYLCVDLHQGLWHDHTGYKNTHISIGMAGTLHTGFPEETQLAATAKVCAWFINSPIFPGVKGPDHIKGHREWVHTYADRGYYPAGKIPYTVCPGWKTSSLPGGEDRWKARFGIALLEALDVS